MKVIKSQKSNKEINEYKRMLLAYNSLYTLYDSLIEDEFFRSIYEKNKIYSRDNDLIYEAKVRNMKKTIFDILELAKNNRCE